MHELGIALQVVDLATARTNGARVRRLVLEIGRLSLVLPDAMRFCWDDAARGTSLDGSALEIVEVDGKAKCRVCSGEVVLLRPLGRCACGSSDLEWVSGMDVKIARLEVD